MENVNIEDRDRIKKERKQRKELKKQKLREKKAQERENALLLKLRPSDQHINIITRNTLEKDSSKIQNTSKQIDLNECMNDFPTLDSIKTKNSIKRKGSIKYSEIDESLSNTVGKHKKSKTPISIDLVEILNPVKTPKTKPAPKTACKILSGNSLDSDNPQRKRGKYKEEPARRRLSKLKKQINLEKKECFSPSNEFQVRSYCDNIITRDLNDTVKNLLQTLVTFQRRILLQEPKKILQKRRFIVGFHETAKLILVNKVKTIIMAPNLQDFDVLKERVEHFKNLAKAHNIEYVFALNRRLIGRIVQRNLPASCVGILDYSGAEDLYQQMLQLLYEARKEYEIEHNVAGNLNDPIEKIVEIVIDKLNIND